MKEIIKYQSDSGRIYDTREQAAAQDVLFAEQNNVSRLLPQAIDDGTRFANGGGYIQHTAEDMIAFHHGIRRLIAMEFGEDHDLVKAWDYGDVQTVGRHLNASNSNTYRLFLRFYSTGSDLREWGQPYFVKHPDVGQQTPWPNVARAGMKHWDK